MIETAQSFCYNIWLWYLEHREGISTFFMSGQFASLIGMIVMTLRNLKQVKSNTDSSKELKDALNKNERMSKSITQLQSDFNVLKEENTLLRADLGAKEEKIIESNSQITDKLNSILEVQSIVYSTIRDDDVRLTVNKILNNARYCDKNFKEELQGKIEEMKCDFEKKLEEVNESVHHSIEDVTNTMNPAEAAKLRSQQLQNDEVIRY